MKITAFALKNLIREALGGSKILKERPWAVEYSFKLSGGSAEDSEGESPDGFAVVMSSDSGLMARFIVDCYWNPQMGDSSGNSLKFELDGRSEQSTYVPTRFDDGKEQRIIISNSPVSGLISVSHAAGSNKVPIVYLTVKNPFDETDDISFSIENIGNGKIDVEMTNYTNL
jgi:hypothetical protein